VGGPVEEFARRGGPVAVARQLGAAVAMVKLGGAVVALTLVRPWGQRLPRRLLDLTAFAGAAVLTLYGGLLVLVGAAVLLGVLGSPPADARALRWHVLVWDLWFLLWGALLAAAALQRRQVGGESRGGPGETVR